MYGVYDEVMNTKETSLSIGGLAKRAGVGVETIRFYERQGLIKRPQKQSSGFRKYDSENARQIRFIKRAQELGFTLKEVKELLGLKVSAIGTCGEIKKRADLKLSEIDKKIADLKRMKRSLKDLSGHCSGGKAPLSDCPILDAFDSKEREE